MILRANLKKLDKGGMGSAGKDQSVISTYEAWKLAGHVDFYRLKKWNRPWNGNSFIPKTKP
jgi:hypothetical protein